MASPLKCDILLITATDVETQAVINSAKRVSGMKNEKKFGLEKTYFDLGVIGNASVFLVRSEMGSVTPGGSLVTVRDAISEVRPAFLIMVGIAFGVDEKKQSIGQVLVSQQLQGYDLERIGTDPDTKQQVIISRGDKTTASVKLIDRFRSAHLDWRKAKVQFGLMLSGQKLVDNLDYREQLKKDFPEACGGEMEGAGLYTSAPNHDWLVVKAICDWADGEKSHNKAESQQLAAQRAAEFVVFTISQGGLALALPATRKPLTPKESIPQSDERSENVKSEDHLVPAVSDEQSNLRSSFRQLVEEHIRDELNKPELSCLREALIAKAEEEAFHGLEPTSEPEELLCQMESSSHEEETDSFTLAVDLLHAATEECLNKLSVQNSANQKIFRDGACTIFGWLILLAVKDDWTEKQQKFLKQKAVRVELSLTLKEEPCVEVLVSFLHQSKASLRKRSDGRIGGNLVIPSSLIETGKEDDRAVLALKQMIYWHVNKERPPEKFTLSDDQNLDAKLEIRKRRKKAHFISIRVSDVNNPLTNKSVRDRLFSDLKNLQVVFIGIEGDDEVFVVPEPHLIGLIEEFLGLFDEFNL